MNKKPFLTCEQNDKRKVFHTALKIQYIEKIPEFYFQYETLQLRDLK